MNIFILEDNVIQQQYLQHLVENYILKAGYKYSENVIITTSRPAELLTKVTEHVNSNVYFLDIQIKDDHRAGLKLAKNIRALDPFGWIVFVTTHSEFLPITYQYKLTALDFIEKDLGEQDFGVRVNECLDIAYSKEKISKSDDIFVFDNQHSRFQIPFADILYFETTELTHKIRLVTLTKHSEFYANLNDIERMDDRLFKCHKSYVVNINNIRRVDKKIKTIFFDHDSESCLVSRNKLKPLLKLLSYN
ncbi:response regulator transcription factor [Lentilactobacillus diolivorans]|uniref:Response regulator protein n=2 Tax=Lentilactobacillus diolivorans TaxID=179838 RepID=A0A0R1S0F4_9LACO|nr:response regulator transcription factor [Lentilactobacillus diolivorans]KRL62497.1 response regulator protein [Lentilactobacillus diolivorans DSM 14421]MDH5105786.1 response regulator transcription factor [Lentilactobacillus diolivorans]GEP25271.1 DNA-binding response regulator [Lentilactobacillus diolivorans]